jgi:hypothetical protein
MALGRALSPENKAQFKEDVLRLIK